MNKLETLIDSLLSSNIKREQKAIMFAEFQATLSQELSSMSTDQSGIQRNRICAFLGNFFVRVQSARTDSYDIQVRKSKLRDMVIQKISDTSQAKGKTNQSLWTSWTLIPGCP